ncbi:uncharacterized protein HMPREF1541_07793 [Cyphellophora europaea CBS 101466]|uniref:Uncharacterized protein n=1 Tax=Cyphellophora europaea (strain CBS 101466) TaxID=1220924 RepID=W2RR11_CYPE1|nr:uncharacterized protein HMPREF1541_07793 [Cyphellophora europaea CBS 101466]ETN38169.1 hypothetical protein HMPREF1541_07793 [Cyphellophora europaea CBS 101466]
MPSLNTEQYAHLPIPTYDEAVSSRPTSRTGPEEISDDAERQGLLRRQSNYEPPTVESARGSLDSLDGIDVPASPGETRREMEQMDIEDPLNGSASSPSLLRQRFAKNFSWTTSFSSLTLPSFRSWVPSFSLPRFNYDSIDSHRAIIIGRLFGIFIILGVVYALIATDILAFGRSRLSIGQMYDPESIRIFVQKHVNNKDMMQDYLAHVTEFPHLAGSEGSYVLAEWIGEVFKTAELEDVDMERFDVYLNYPKKNGRRLAIVEPKDRAWEATVKEEAEQTAVFHGHAKAGDVKGPVVYANYGSRDDFKKLSDEGIDITGAIVLMRYYGTQEDAALKVKAAEMAGAVGAVLYTDPADNGYVKGPAFPAGRFLPEDGVQRDSVSLQSWVVGDVLSPGWASTPGNKQRNKKEDSAGLNKIPSLPISWNDAKHLLDSIKGLGKQMNRDWQGEKKIEYWTGDQNSPVVNLKNEQDDETYQPIYNVVGRITGWEQPEKRIVVGNHHDAWCLGAANPGTGTSIMLDVIRIFGELRRLGWRPLRTIEFASWDSAVYNLEGSTEHVENRLDELRKDGVAYVNLGAGVSGSDLIASGSPTMRRALLDAINRVRDPATDEDDNPKSVKQAWEELGQGISPPGGRVDYVPFQHMVGMSSIDVGFRGDRYPSGSCYDRYDWVSSEADSGFLYHKALGEIVALIILELSDKPMLPFDLEAYAADLHRWADDLASYARDNGMGNLDFTPLQDSIGLVAGVAKQTREIEEHWARHVFSHGGFEGNRFAMMRIMHNDRVAQFEKDLLDLSQGGGLKNRTQYKHTVFAPMKWDSTRAATFPGVRDAIDEEGADAGDAQLALQLVADKLRDAAANLRRPPGEGPEHE